MFAGQHYRNGYETITSLSSIFERRQYRDFHKYNVSVVGMDINLVISGLATLGCFVQEAVWVDSEKTILQALTKKLKHGQSVSQDFIRNGLKEFMYS